jgi:hypothetical protein
MARIWHGGWRSSDVDAPAVLGFFGARYAVVRDPAGNGVGLMSPIDQHRRFTPGL